MMCLGTNDRGEPIPLQADKWFEFSIFLLGKKKKKKKKKKIKEPYYLSIAEGRIVGFIPYPKGISAMGNVNGLV